ncbi:hypothetical protein WJX72_000480 [[Myrmecia] bisecta]|uniref:Uncharacterized protein n=1 Tax=[Myrmecia] bisecta TaxID=41462 RepID=A0AAW1PVI0_9CHLO
MVVRAQNSVRRQRAYVVLVLLFTAIHAQRPPLEQAQLATIADISQARHRALLQAGSAGGPSVEFLYALTTVEEGSLAVAQVAEVLAEIKLAISSYVSPTSADISAVVARALAVAGRHLLQAQSSLQPTVKFVSTLSSKPVGDPATVSQYQAAISDFLAPLAVQITTSAVGSNQLSTTVLFPPNNQVSTTPSQSTAAAQNFMQTVRDQPAAIFSTFDTVSASALQTNVALVQANPGNPSTPAPAPASHPLTVLVQVAFPQGAEQVAQSLVATLQAKPEDVFFAVAARNGPLTVSNVGYTPSPLPAPATAPPRCAGLVLARPTPVPPQDDNSTSGIPQTTPAASGAMFAMNMQFTTGSASTDNPVNTIVLALDKTPTAPLASDFAVDLKPGTSGGSVAAVLPYLNDAFFLLRVDSPEGYIGPVTVAYPSSSVAPLTYHVKSRLVVKVTASSADGVQ